MICTHTYTALDLLGYFFFSFIKKFTCSTSVLTVRNMREGFLNKTSIYLPVLRNPLVHHKAPHRVRGNSCMRRFLTQLSFLVNFILIFILHCKRNVESTSTSAPKASSPHAIESPNKEATPAPAPVAASLSTPLSATTPPENKDIENFDDFDPRASVSGKWTYFNNQQAKYTSNLFS